ncbi:MAG TPA: EamA family transporter [Hypericibacter adhaerens]|jgi:drug/metabolite transporter (DMT)-like permease|uniref:DMT family transporter n=1 Tax=Hypericibacter adhaerens TaxID=2602016 RepID=UPI002C5CD0ED|nr:EamA family transporter [Hypericibacter adhaerens]HWA45255.1 EamA family transporter [Hypericibacter adhaerens]
MTLADTTTPAAAPGRAALAVLLLGAVAVSFSGIFVKISELGPSATGFHRLFLALPLLLLWQGVEARHQTKAPARPQALRDFWILALPGLYLAADLVCWHWSIRLTTAATATLLGNTAPIFVTLIAWLVYGQRFRPGFVLGLTVALGGVAALIGAVHLDMTHIIGNLAGIGAGITYAGYIITIKAARERFSTAQVMTWTAVSGLVVMLIAALVSGESLVPMSLRGWAILVGLAWISQVGGQSMIAWALRHLPVAFSSVSMLVNPVATFFLAWFLVGERLTPWQILAGVVVLAGILIARLYSERRG